MSPRVTWCIFVKIFPTEVYRCDQSRIQPVWIRVIDRSDKMSESSVVVACVHFCVKLLPQKIKLTSEKASYIFPWSLRNQFKMATKHVADKQSEKSEDFSPSACNGTTAKKLIQFCKVNRLLWDKNLRNYGKKLLQIRCVCTEQASSRSDLSRLVLEAVNTEQIVA